MNDHPEVPRVEFYGDGHSMNVEEAVERFRKLLHMASNDIQELSMESWSFNVDVKVRACDCDETLEGRDDHCPLHGNPELQRTEG